MDKEKAKENRMIQQFFKNKIFWGIDLEKMNASM